MKIVPAPEFFYLAEAYFHQDFGEVYGDLRDLTQDVLDGFESYGSKAELKRTLIELTSRLSDGELDALWRQTNADTYLANGAELRRVLKHIAAAL